MQIELSKQDLIALIKGLTGYEDYMFAAELSKDGWGELTGFPNEKWYWNDRAFQVRSEWQLLEFYNRLKKKAEEDKTAFFNKHGFNL
jgi:hypothetical protein